MNHVQCMYLFTSMCVCICVLGKCEARVGEYKGHSVVMDKVGVGFWKWGRGGWE